MELIEKLIITYLLIVNIVTLIIFGVDKLKAMRNKYRISEATLLVTSFVGGSLGGILAMYIFRHKTRVLRFKIGLPIMLIFHIALILYLGVI